MYISPNQSIQIPTTVNIKTVNYFDSISFQRWWDDTVQTDTKTIITCCGIKTRCSWYPVAMEIYKKEKTYVNVLISVAEVSRKLWLRFIFKMNRENKFISLQSIGKYRWMRLVKILDVTFAHFFTCTNVHTVHPNTTMENTVWHLFSYTLIAKATTKLLKNADKIRLHC